MTTAELLERLDGAKPTGDDRWEALCPAHDDRTPSLSISTGDEGRVLLHCHAGCSTTDVLAGLGLTEADLFERRNGGGMDIAATYPYVDEAGELLYEVVRFRPKSFRQRRPDGNGGWEWSLKGVQRVLYRLPKVVEVAMAGGKVCVVEGEKDVAALERLGLTATCNAGGAGKWRAEYAESLRGAQVGIIADADAPGRKHATEVAASLDGIAASVKLLEPAEGCKDVSDHLAAGKPLSELVPVEASDAPPKASEPVDRGPPPDTAELLDGVEALIHKYVVTSDEQRCVLALWALHTHVIAAADTTPYIAITSAEKRSGKSRLLEILAQLVPRPLEAANISDAALFRALGAEDELPATVLFDEVDAVFKAKEKEELRGLLNAGYRRGAKAYRCVGEGAKQTVTPFPVFGPKALAGIGELPDTIADRSIPIRLRRRSRDEPVARGRYKLIAVDCEPLRVEAERWAVAHVGLLREAEPDLPEELNDREQDGGEPLIAIADLAGGEWPRLAREALVTLHAEKPEDGASWGVQLLADIRGAFGEDDRLSTSELLVRLKLDDEGPWGAWGKADTGLNARGLAKLLAPFEISSRSVRLPDGSTPKGFKRDQFFDAWERYLPSGSASKTPHRHNGSVEPKTADFYPPQDSDVADRKVAANPHSNAVVAGVADKSANRRAGAVEQGSGKGASTPAEVEAEAELAGSPPCRYPAHRSSDYAGESGQAICGTCHPRAGGST
jgi:5S rRNA maturation endonuclease (ribonuclease M5)